MIWSLKKFDELSVDELYSILQLRNIVFAVEQNCVYPDMDDKDQVSYHLTCTDHNKLAAYTRIIPPGIVYKEPSIGRVVTAPAYRGAGIGKQLMDRSIETCEKLFGKTPIRISAQTYLIKFYTDLGFQTEGDPYIEDSIQHIAMVRF
jgi:ElaA protein